MNPSPSTTVDVMLTKNFIPMKLSWTSIKISIAGAKLSHLVQRDKIWDHGSMVEQVRNIFYVVQRAKSSKETEIVKKCLTAKGFEKFKLQLNKPEKGLFEKNVTVTEISIVQVSPGKKERQDCFKALIKGKRKSERGSRYPEKENHGIENFSEEWFFVRQGDWWLLDGIKT
jgi:predicted lipid-binding transport protein (Tim44 family)